MKKPEAEVATDPLLAKYGVKDGEWQYILKLGWRYFQRPGKHLAVRIIATLHLHALGYRIGGGELCIKQIPAKKPPKGDPPAPRFVPISPTDIRNELAEVAVEEFRASGKEPTKAERKKFLPTAAQMRHALDILDAEDRAITCVTTAKRGQESLFELATAGLSFEEAVAQKLVIPIRDLPRKGPERRQLAGRSFMYLHARPRPATIAALTRRTDDDGFLGKSKKEIRLELSTGAQRVFRFVRSLGVEDPRIAETMSKAPTIVAQIEELLSTEVAMANIRQRQHEAQAALKASLVPLVEAYRRGEPIPSAPPIPTGVDDPQLAQALSKASQAPIFPPQLVPSPTAQPSQQFPPGDPVHVQPAVSAAVNSTGMPSGPPPAASHATAADSPLVSQPRSSRPAPVNPPRVDPKSAAPEGEIAAGARAAGVAGGNAVSVSAAQFNEALCVRFHAVGANLPTRQQTTAAYSSLSGTAQQFLDWLTALEMQRRKPKHGGILPSLVEEFLQSQKLGPAPAAEESPRDMLLRSRGIREGTNG